jgi:hypothetical protein
MSLVEYLQERGIELEESDLVSALDKLLGEHLVADTSAALTKDAEDVLDRIGPRPRPRAVPSATAATVAEAIELLGSSRAVGQVAEDLGVDPSRIRHRVADGALYAVRIGRRLLLPAWQFNEGFPLPSLAAVMAALPPNLHPLEVAGFMTSPQEDLELRGTLVSPKKWLAGGGDPSTVIELAKSLSAAA